MMSKYEKNTAPDVKWQDITLACDVFEGGTAAAIETGDWRTIKPVIDWDKCKQCLLCAPVCPDMSIPVTVSNGQIKINMGDYPKVYVKQ